MTAIMREVPRLAYSPAVVNDFAYITPRMPSTTTTTTRTNTNAARSPDRGSIEQIAAKALQTRTVTVDRMHGSLSRTYRLRANAEAFYVLRCRPSINVRLLRSEESRMHAEVQALQALQGGSDVMVPRLIECQAASSSIDSPYFISGPFRGVALSDMKTDLSARRLNSIERSLGSFVRRLTTIRGSQFGSPLSSPSYSRNSTRSASSASSWAKCFGQMLESILRDAEDALVSVPYDFIREQLRRHRAALDQITQPRLVLVEMIDHDNLLIDPKTATITGVLNWSSAMWGDAYLSDCFYQPTMGFVEGFGQLPNSTTDERIRQYLYILYHALSAIVRHCYRSSEGGDELKARRNLTSALTQLSSIPR